jgi:hypothetical protein
MQGNVTVKRAHGYRPARHHALKMPLRFAKMAASQVAKSLLIPAKALTMNAMQTIKKSLDVSSMICMAYVGDLDDTELLRRPAPGCNHINWQIGHLLASEHATLDKVAPGALPPLPAGFAEKYTKDTAASDDAKTFCSKVELMRIYEQQRAGILAALDKQSESDLDKPSGIDWCPTVGEAFNSQGAHWLMHSGQWVVVRRLLGRPPLF